MKIGIIGAMQMEMDNLKEAMNTTGSECISGVTFVQGTIGKHDIVAAVCGVGKVFAAICAEAMILRYQVDLMINIGVGGSLTRDLAVLDVALATNMVQHDMDTSPLGDPVGLLSGINVLLLPADTKMVEGFAAVMEDKGIHYKKGIIATGDQFIATKEQKDRIVKHFDAIAAEMEGGSIAHVCYVNRVPFAVLRSISDSEGGAMDYQTFAEQAAVQSIEIVLAFIERL